jgi:hypothetical protein
LSPEQKKVEAKKKELAEGSRRLAAASLSTPSRRKATEVDSAAASDRDLESSEASSSANITPEEKKRRRSRAGLADGDELEVYSQLPISITYLLFAV